MNGKVARALSWHSTVHELFLSESIVFCKDTSEAIKSSGLNAAADHEMLSKLLFYREGRKLRNILNKVPNCCGEVISEKMEKGKSVYSTLL